MEIEDGFDDSQPQAEAVVIGFAGLVALVEADEDIFQLVVGERRAGIGDGDMVGGRSVMLDIQRDDTASGRIFDGVFHQCS